jgi:hypothetical protein
MAIQITKRPYSKCFSGNPIHYELYSMLAANDTSIFFEVRVMFKGVGDANYTSIVDLPFYPTEGYAAIDIKDILHSELNYGVTPFFTDEKTFWESTKQTGYFYLQYREITTSNPNPSWDDSEKDFAPFVVKGGFNFFFYRGNNYWVNYYPVQKPFLTWQKSKRLAAIWERMYLAWLNDYATSANLRVTAKIYYTDGSVSALQTISGIMTKGYVYYMPAGAFQWGLANVDPTKVIYFWTIQVMDYSDVANPVAISELFTYKLDNRNDYNQTILHYRNSLGGLDSVRIRGVIEEDLNYDYSQQETTTTPDYFSGERIQSQLIIADNLEQLIYKGDIGHLGKEEQDRLRDAFILREVYWEISKKWWPVIITTKSNKLRTTLDNRWTLPIEWQLAYNGGEYYTPKNVDLGDGVFTDNVCLAYLNQITVTAVTDLVHYPDPLKKVTINFNKVDPQAASTQVRYRVLKASDGTIIINWTTVPIASIIFGLNKDDAFMIEIQPICANNYYGPKSTVSLDTHDAGSGGTGGGGIGGGSPSGNSFITNNTNTGSGFILNINAISLSAYVGANSTLQTNVADVADATISLNLGSISPSYVVLVSNGLSYTGSISGNVVSFSHVDVSGGLTINIY